MGHEPCVQRSTALPDLTAPDKQLKHTKDRNGFKESAYFWQPTVHAQQNIFEKTLIEVGSSHLYVSFSPFCIQIGQLFEAQ